MGQKPMTNAVPSFDKSQFAGRSQYPVGATMTATGWLSNGLSFDDYSRMSTHKRKTSGERRLPTPLWAMNDFALRRVLVTFMEERAFSKKERLLRATADKQALQELRKNHDLRTRKGKKMLAIWEEARLRERLDAVQRKVATKRPAAALVMDQLCAKYVEIKQKGLKPGMTDKEWNESRNEPYMEFAEGEARYQDEKNKLKRLEVVIEGIDTYLRYTVHGGADVVVSAVYLYYRCGMDSIGVANELGLKSPHIRQTLYRLHQTAKTLWPPNGSPSQPSAIVGSKEKAGKASKGIKNRASKTLYTPQLFKHESAN